MNHPPLTIGRLALLAPALAAAPSTLDTAPASIDEPLAGQRAVPVEVATTCRLQGPA